MQRSEILSAIFNKWYKGVFFLCAGGVFHWVPKKIFYSQNRKIKILSIQNSALRLH